MIIYLLITVIIKIFIYLKKICIFGVAFRKIFEFLKFIFKEKINIFIIFSLNDFFDILGILAILFLEIFRYNLVIFFIFFI